MIVVDFETTGLLSSNPNPEAQPGIVQIGLIELTDKWEVEREFLWLVNPEKPIEPDAIKTHGITDDKVKGERTLPALLPEIAKIFRRHTTWVGFNNSFDWQVLFHQLVRYNWQTRFPWPSQDIDIMRVGADIVNMAGKQGNKPPKLTELHLALTGRGFDNAHDALADCRATAVCGKILAEKGYLL